MTAYINISFYVALIKFGLTEIKNEIRYGMKR